MALKIISADERMAAAHLRGSVFVGGGFKVGKTSLLFSLPEAETLFLDFESGDKSVLTWRGDKIEIRDFVDAVDITCLIGGIDPSSWPNDMFSKEHYDSCKAKYPEIAAKVDQYKFIFFDSISRLSFAAAKYAKQQPEAFNDKGRPDKWGMYGLIASSMVGIIVHMQHSQKNTVFIGLLEDVEDDFGRHQWKVQLEGAKTGRELPGVVDQVISMVIADYNDATGEWSPNNNGEHRIFICKRANPWGYPAGTRSVGNIEMVEEPHLGKVFDKLNAPAKQTETMKG